MEQYKKEFIEFMVDSNVLRFGEFTLKSGRKSPFFMNAGAYITGSQLRRLGAYYAQAIHDNYGTDFDVLFGPAYKGIPLAVASTMAFSELYGRDIRYCSNRKEIKDHGDVGILLGSDLNDGDRVVIIEDVTTPEIHRGNLSNTKRAGKCGRGGTDGELKPSGARQDTEECARRNPGGIRD